ncbi:hypothetical protein Smic_77700 [Streptomyces microflavus]|uniref:Uncharacterized protein n=1 Tax=Streptomyces microflavus TaxID=1919 RepID=A0A7J0D4U8_STRMI|nr:hypothetical protein Smic_77700 [Streptomyces microflavus]
MRGCRQQLRGHGSARRRGHRDQRETHQQALRRHQTGAVAGADGALAGVAGQPLAPQGGRDPVPAAEDVLQQYARRVGGQRAHHDPGGLQLRLHPLDADGRVLLGELQGRRDLGP